MLQIRAHSFDRAYVRRALVEMVPGDPRIDKWDEICVRNPLPEAS
jgi:hypothetical protein